LEVLGDGSNYNYNVIDWTESIKMAKYAKIWHGTSDPVAGGGS
jgi:hypothetical protein